MGQQKGQIPAHIKPTEFVHPQEEHPLIVILRDVEDPRPGCSCYKDLIYGPYCLELN